MKIVPFASQYRDDMIFMILEAKNALGRVPGLNHDLLDIEKHYLNKGDMFWLALDENDRVIGSIGYSTNADPNTVTLHRLFVKYNIKHQGIGSALLQTAEEHIKAQGKKIIYVHLGDREQWYESHNFYPKHGYIAYQEDYMKKEI